MVSRYSSLFSHRTFVVLWTSTALLNLATTIASLGLGLLVQQATHSAFLSAAVMFGPSLAQAVGGLTAMSVADTRPPRAVIAMTSAGIAILIAGQSLPLSTWLRIVIAFFTAYLLSLSTGARYGTLSEILPQTEYSLGRSAINIAVGVTQLIGYSVGALLMGAIDVRAVLLLAAAIAAVSAVVLRGLPEFSARSDAAGGVAETIRTNRQLLTIPGVRSLVLALIVPNSLIVGCEALFVSFHPTAGGSGVLFVAAASGMLLGDILTGRILGPVGRVRAARLLRFLLAAPFLFFVFDPSLWIATALVVVATVGYGASVVQQEMLNWITPLEMSGRTFGFESSMRMAAQGFFSLIAGGLADRLTPERAMLVLALASLAVSVKLSRGLADIGRRYLRSLANPRDRMDGVRS